MNQIPAILSVLLCASGTAFFVAGTVGLLRFPDVYSRLHALSKADNLGLGLVAIGLAVQTASWFAGLKILVIWVLALVASATACNLIAQSARRAGIEPWRRGQD